MKQPKENCDHCWHMRNPKDEAPYYWCCGCQGATNDAKANEDA